MQDLLNALQLAAISGKLSSVKYLVNRFGDSKFDLDNLGQNCLHKAVVHGHRKIVRYLIEECGFDPSLGDLVRCGLLSHISAPRSLEHTLHSCIKSKSIGNVCGYVEEHMYSVCTYSLLRTGVMINFIHDSLLNTFVMLCKYVNLTCLNTIHNVGYSTAPRKMWLHCMLSSVNFFLSSVCALSLMCSLSSVCINFVHYCMCLLSASCALVSLHINRTT